MQIFKMEFTIVTNSYALLWLILDNSFGIYSFQYFYNTFSISKLQIN